MSSWVPLRTAPSEPPLCSPSTSYSAIGVAMCSARLREQRCGGQSHRGKALYHIRCLASQALHSYHNAFKLIQKAARTAELAPTPSASAPRDPGRQGPAPAQPDAPQPSPPLLPSESRPAQQHKSFPITNSDGQHTANGAAAPDAPAPLPPPSPPFSSSPDSGTATTATSAASSLLLGSLLDFGSVGQGPSSLSCSASSPSDLRPYTPHAVSLPHWQPPPSSLQHRVALTRALYTCPTYTRLHQLILDNCNDFDTFHSCAALSRLLTLHASGLSPRESRLFKEGCSTLQTILRRQIPVLRPRSVVIVVYSLARLELPDRELLAGLAAAVEPHLAALQPQGLSSLLWAFARQNHQPPPKWMDAALSACSTGLPSFTPRDMATVIWALARLHYKVSPSRLSQMLGHVQACMGEFSGRSLSNVMYALALSQQHPGGEWLAAAQARAVALGPDGFTPQGMTQMAWALAKLGGTPIPGFLEMVLEHAAQRLLRTPQDRERNGAGDVDGDGDDGAVGAAAARVAAAPQQQRRRGPYNGIDLATLLYSLASLGGQPRADFGRRLLAAVQWELPFMEANGLCNCLWACARLRLYPTKMWLSCFFDASYRQLAYFKAVDIAQALWAMARLQVSPPALWMSHLMTRLQHSASMFSPVEVATTMWALAQLGVRSEELPGEVLALFFIATDRRLSSFKPKELTSMIWALAHMRRRPDKEWAAEFLKVTYHKLPSMNGWCLATLAWSLAELSLLPPPAWIYSYVNAARALMNTPLVAAAAAAPSAPPAAYALGDGDEDAAAGLSALDLGQIIIALRRLNGSSNGKSAAAGGSGSGGLAKVEEFLREAEQRLAEVEVGNGAYARQQVETLLAMSPRKAGLPPPVASSAAAAEQLQHQQPQQSSPRMAVPEPNGDICTEAVDVDASGGGSAAAAAVVSATGKAARTKRRRGRAPAAAVKLSPAPRDKAKQERRKGAFAGRAAKSGAAVAMAAAAAEAIATAAAASPPREVTRVLNNGARVTLTVPSNIVVDLGGDLNVDLSASPSGAVLWRPAAGAAVTDIVEGVGGNGDNNQYGSSSSISSSSSNGGNGSGEASSASGASVGDGDAAVSTAEIKRRLLAV